MSAVFSSKFVKILKTFSGAELRSFENWLRSPWCNSNKNLPRLLEKMRKYHPDFTEGKITKEKLFRQVLPQGKFSDRRMNNLLSEGYMAAERFLAFERFSRSTEMQSLLLLQEFEDRQTDEWFFRSTKKEIERAEENPVKNWEDHARLFLMHRGLYHHPNLSSRLQPENNTIDRMQEELTLAYLLEAASIINEMIFRNRLLNAVRHDVSKMLRVWQIMSEGVEHPAIDLYKMRFAYTDEQMLDQFLALRSAFADRFESLNLREQKIHLLSLLNDSAYLCNQSRLDITERLPLYQLGLKTGLLFHRGKLTYNTYIMIVTISNTKGSFEFTEQFIQNHTKDLDPKVQEDCATWARAHVAYRQNRFAECLTMLQSREFKLFHFQLVSRFLTTQAYFDLFLRDDSYQFYLFNYFDSFEKWLLREKVWSAFNKKTFLRFIQNCRALAKCYADVNFQPEKLEQLLDKENAIQGFNWLQQKRAEIIRLKAERPLDQRATS